MMLVQAFEMRETFSNRDKFRAQTLGDISHFVLLVSEYCAQSSAVI